MLGEIFNWQFLIITVMSAVASVGFSLLFRLNGKHLACAAIGGSMTYVVYYLVEVLTGSLFLAGLISSISFSLYSEIMARVKRAPAVVFLLPSAIPIVPGGSLYYSMSALIGKNTSLALFHLTNAVMIGIGIAAGTVVVSVAFAAYRGVRQRLNASQTAKKENNH